MTQRTSFRLCAALYLVVLVGCASGRGGARKDAPPSYPMTVRDWHGIDRVEFVKPFPLSDYDSIYVKVFERGAVWPYDDSDAPYSDETDTDDATDAAKDAVGAFSGLMAVHLQKSFPDKHVDVKSVDKAPHALIVRGRLAGVDGGSRGKRFWVGFGLGNASIEASGEIVDGNTGEVLAKFHDYQTGGGSILS